MAGIPDAHFKSVVQAISIGKVVPLLGAGVNLCGRPAGAKWKRGRYLPSGSELAKHLAKTYLYPLKDGGDLLRVSQFITADKGPGPLYDELRGLFNADYPPTVLHEFLAELPGLLRKRGRPHRYQLIVTTNYDDVLERAFDAVNEPFDLVSYIAEGEDRGKFLHRSAEGLVELIEKPNEYHGLSLDQRTVILKVHGAIDRRNKNQDSYVITEDHYIDYLVRSDFSNIAKFFPVTLASELRHSHFLFLGYSLRDWNLRVILHRIWGEQKLSWKSWAVQLNPDALDQLFWRKRDVEILDARLEEYVEGLRKHLQAITKARGRA